MANVSQILFFLCIGFALGGIIGTVCEMIQFLRRNKSKELEYSIIDYSAAEMKLQKYKERALEVYRLLDPDQRLLSGGYDGSFNYMPFVFKKGEKPELMVVLTFHDADDADESYENESRQAWFPFELMNSDYISSLNVEDKISIEWTTKSLPYGGGKQWKMVARFAGPIDEKFLNNRMK